MSITEITTIGWKTPYSWDTDTVRDFITQLRPSQTSHSGHPLFWFTPERTTPTSPSNPNEAQEAVCLTGWPTIDAHLAWVRDIGAPLLGGYAGRVLELHGQLHLGVDFAAIPRDVRYLVWESCSVTEEEAQAEPWQEGSTWTTTARVIDEGAEGVCTLWAFEQRPIGLVLGESGTRGAAVTRVGLVRLDADVESS